MQANSTRCQFHAALLAAALLPWLAPAACPASDPEPLPALQPLLRRIKERIAQEVRHDQSFLEHYAFTLAKRTDTRNARGEVKKSVRHTAAHDPRTAPAESGAPARPPSHEKFRKDEARGRAYERRDFRVDDELLKRFTISIAGRELIAGRPALVLDFAPAIPQPPARSLKERFISKAAGRVWVDEAEAAPVKMDLRLTGEVSVVGGLVGTVKKLLVGFTRERTAEGWWYTRTVTWHLEGRQFLASKVLDYDERRSDVTRVK